VPVLSDAAAFTQGELDRSRRFHRPRHVALVLQLAIGIGILTALTERSLPGPWWIAAILTPVAVELVAGLARLPVGIWRYRQDVRYGLSDHAPRGFAVDVAKGLAVGAVLTAAALAPLFALAHWLPVWWPVPAAVGAALLVVGLTVLAPLVVEPVFNRFRPLERSALVARLRTLADRAGSPVREILVADASRRTARRNAYVSGLGRTRRVVVWDTLLDEPEDEIAVVVAHELGHRARRHVAWLTALAMVAAAAFVLGLRLVVARPTPDDTAGILLLGFLCELALLPFGSALSRRFERSADRFSLELTHDPAAYTSLHRRLALANLAELEPPRLLYYWFFSHPTPPERLRAVESMS